MTPRKRVLLLISIMAFVVLLVLVSSLFMLFRTALDDVMSNWLYLQVRRARRRGRRHPRDRQWRGL